MNSSIPISRRERDSILQSLRAGVVPRMGQPLIQVGRKREIQTLIDDIVRISEGGSAFRLVIAEYGAGKTFLLNLVRSVAMEKKLVVMNADLNPDRRLQASGGQARSLYAELTRNLSTRTKPDGGALAGIVEKFILTAKNEAQSRALPVSQVIEHKLGHIHELVNGFDFATVVQAYCKGAEENDELLRTNALRWLRGEFSTRTDARQALGVRGIVEDSSVYDQLKLIARFVRISGFSGLLVCLDEMVNLYKLANTAARNSNYEQILRILNDSLQGNSEGLGFFLGGTPEFLMDNKRGLYSYQALQSRLAQNTFASEKLVDFSGPVIHLASLSPEDFFVLLQKVRRVHSFGDDERISIPDEGIVAFMKHCSGKIGDSYFRTPRTTITAFIDMLSILDQNKDASWQSLVGNLQISADKGGLLDLEVAEPDDNDLASFKL